MICSDPEANHYCTNDFLVRGGSEISDYGLSGVIARAHIPATPNDQSTQKCVVDLYSKTSECTKFVDVLDVQRCKFSLYLLKRVTHLLRFENETSYRMNITL